MSSESGFVRRLSIQLPPRQSAFLWGARKTGKSTYLRSAFPDSAVFDFLETELLVEYTGAPSRFREAVLALSAAQRARPIILDEVQKVPGVLDEVHLLIERHGLQFVLCGSSARKLKRGHANLLGGRAWRFTMNPLCSAEVPGLDLMRALRQGLIPTHYLAKSAGASLRAYTLDYLKEEVFDEGLTRNLPAFSRFFDALGFCAGEQVNYSSVARDAGVDSKTVREYFQILIDTQVGRLVEPFVPRRGRSVLSKAPKFYLFDVGVSGQLQRRVVTDTRGEAFGKAFEEFIHMELCAWQSYAKPDLDIRYWRTKTGHEVDFILSGGETAIEVKSGRIDKAELHGINAFIEDAKPKRAFIVSTEKTRRKVGEILVIPWREFLEELWGGGVG
jgi:predicted AAA+ superfamily ATPase